MANERDAFGELRRRFDSNDPFMTGGHRLLKMRRHQRSVPEWVRNENSIREMLLQIFPKLMTNDKQRQRAAVWARVIHLYFRLGYTESYIAGEMETTISRIRSLVRSVYRAQLGVALNSGKPRTGPVGRPRRKISA
jgi:hypothetical protein